jgi:adenylosuccinate synthase
MPWHQRADALLEAAVAHTSGEAKKIGTTGRGIGPCYADKALRCTAIRVIDLCNEQVFARRVQQVLAVQNATLAALAEMAGEPFDPFDPEAIIEQYRAYAERLTPYVCDTAVLLNSSMQNKKRVLFEGANASLLDVDHGTYPFVTSSNCSASGIFNGAGVPHHSLGRVIGIMKAYTSRVGGGPFVTEQDNEIGQTLRDRGNEYGTTTGRPRRTGWLDLVATRYTAMIGGVSEIACTGMSVLAGLDRVNVCVGYRHGGQVLEDFPADADLLMDVEPVYEELEGFAGPLDGCRDFDELPAPARAYIDFVEQRVGVPISMVCVGRRRDQILVR